MWGILPYYISNTDERRKARPAAAAAVIRAMGGDPEGEPSPIRLRTRVVRTGQRVALAGAAELTLEDGTQLQVAKTLPRDLPFGYHYLQPHGPGLPELIIKSPGACFLDPAMPVWGWAVQLYALRSRRSWGFGDLADLRDLGEWAAGLGAGALVVNPLAAVAPTLPQEASPYSPSSRRFRNPLYLCVPEIPGAAELVADSKWPQVMADAATLNAQRHIDRDRVYGLKLEALGRLWSRQRAAVCQDTEFLTFCRRQGPGLDAFAAYCVLAECFGSDWRQWPAAYRHPAQAGVRSVCDERMERVQFHKWLQWRLDQQLAHAAGKLAIVQDLPISVDLGGADAWEWQGLWADGATLGAPPDAFKTEGQNWNLAPWVPHQLREAQFRPFIETLRATLRHARGLRIDHVMGLFRLFWIPQGFPNAEGLYVQYPADELLAIVAIESHRAGAWIAGEDLGTVAPEMRRQLAKHRMLSYRLLWFEDGSPGDYPQLSLAAVSTHDLPTVAGLWSGADYAAQEQLGLSPIAAEYARMRERLIAATELAPAAAPEEACLRAHAALAAASSAVRVANLDDALAVEERPNMPGTVREWPNWCLALPASLEELQAAALPRAIAQVLSRHAATG
jgi:4-alpha-glucanotransferase